ncbi:MAG: NAD(P)H-binding protein [Chitinophagaceae bacterium]|nr:NAD(P)H-binding protein [Chitinophagaceae bacterium]
MQTIFITGGTGYIGSRLIKFLQQKGDYHIKALIRQGSAHKLPAGCESIVGNALNAETFSNYIRPATIFVHLIGVAHPSPSKKQQFRQVDLVSVKQAALAAIEQGIEHFIYLSVAQHPTEIMKDYQAVRASGEALLVKAGIPCSFIRPWYVLGPGHWWPLLLKPFYMIARLIPAFREKAQNLDTVTIGQMVAVLSYAIEHPPVLPVKVYEVADIQLMNGSDPHKKTLERIRN